MADQKISKDLFLAILSMDSYNRGYEAGIADGEGPKDADGKEADGLGEAGRQVGGAASVGWVPTHHSHLSQG